MNWFYEITASPASLALYTAIVIFSAIVFWALIKVLVPWMWDCLWDFVGHNTTARWHSAKFQHWVRLTYITEKPYSRHIQDWSEDIEFKLKQIEAEQQKQKERINKLVDDTVTYLDKNRDELYERIASAQKGSQSMVEQLNTAVAKRFEALEKRMNEIIQESRSGRDGLHEWLVLHQKELAGLNARFDRAERAHNTLVSRISKKRAPRG